jgi:hypothetical protein
LSSGSREAAGHGGPSPSGERERESGDASERRERGPPTSISSCRIRQTHRADGSETSGRRSRAGSAGRSRTRPPVLDPPLLHRRRGQGRLDLGAVGPSSRPASGHRGRRSAPASPPPCSTPPIAAPHHRPAPGRPRAPASLPGSPVASRRRCIHGLCSQAAVIRSPTPSSTGVRGAEVGVRDCAVVGKKGEGWKG